jgi:hypothetical protein
LLNFDPVGTWLNSNSNSLKNSVAIPSNVTRISRAIKPLSSDGIPQIVFYHHGVGAGGGITDKLMGISGEGLAQIVREGYQFIASNYVPGDEIFIFGFSRGAFSARSIAGLIGEIGILNNEGLPFLAEIFRDVQNRHDENYRPKHRDIPFPDKPSVLNPDYKYELERRRMTRLDVPVKVVGCFETVGALGTPKIGWLTRVGLQSSRMRELSFYDTALGNHIEFAFQALALDERRYAFPPALWEKFEGNTTTLRQVWFPGAHSNVGGGYDDQQIATISLAWMMAQCQPFLDFDVDYIHDQYDDVEMYYEKTDQKPRPWSFGKIWSGLEGVYAIGGANVRTPGRYCAIDPTNGKQTDEPLIDTHEYIHPSVRARIKLHGPGLDDRGDYSCPALKNWKLNIEYPDDGTNRPRVFYKARDKTSNGFVKVLPEAPLWNLEMELLRYDRETEDYVMKPSPVRQGAKRKRRSRSRPPTSFVPSRVHSRAPSRAPSPGYGSRGRDHGKYDDDDDDDDDDDADRDQSPPRRLPSRAPSPVYVQRERGESRRREEMASAPKRSSTYR